MALLESKKCGKDQESIHSSTTPLTQDTTWEIDKNTIKQSQTVT